MHWLSVQVVDSQSKVTNVSCTIIKSKAIFSLTIQNSKYYFDFWQNYWWEHWRVSWKWTVQRNKKYNVSNFGRDPSSALLLHDKSCTKARFCKSYLLLEWNLFLTDYLVAWNWKSCGLIPSEWRIWKKYFFYQERIE